MGAAGDFAEWRATFDVNIFGSLQMTRAALGGLRVNGGAVVFVSSQTQHHPPPLAPQMAYGSSKSALTGAMHILAQEVGPDNIRVNAVCPQYIESELLASLIEKEMRERKVDRATAAAGFSRANPLGRTGTPEEVADLVSFLVSEPANFVTGSAVSIDGGYHRYVFG